MNVKVESDGTVKVDGTPVGQVREEWNKAVGLIWIAYDKLGRVGSGATREEAAEALAAWVAARKGGK